MSDHLTSIDEFLSSRKDFVRDGNVLIKASRGTARSWDKEKRTVRFTMSAEVEDRDRDIVHQDGLKTEAFAENPQAFFNHRSWDRPVGSWSDVEKILNGRPKRTEGTLRLAPEGINKVADELALDLDAGLIKACSIGFIPKAVKKRAVPEDKRDADFYWPGYDIFEAEMVECSPCTIPSNPAALAKSAAQGNVMAREMIEEVLDKWALDPVTRQLVSREEFEEAYRKATGGAKGVVLSFTLKDGVDAEEFVNAVSAVAETVGTANPQAPAETPPAVDADPVPNEPETIDLNNPDLTQPQARSFLRRVLDIAFGAENQQKLEEELRAKKLRDAEEAVALAARREALEKRYQTIQGRAAEKGLV